MQSQIVCPRCSAAVQSGSRFCPACGSSLGAGAEDATAKLAGVDELLLALQADTAGVFSIERELGRGGMGAVFLAEEIALGRKVAIKVLPPEFTFSTESAERFRREARTAASLDHPNIVAIHRVSQGGKLLWFAMKFLEGRGLDQLMSSSGRMSLDETVAILSQAADALDFAHSRGIVHRDFKPQNVVLDARGKAVVTDFGLAKARQGTKLTATGGVLGTPHYMAPEQWLGGELSGATDQYALAIVAYQMLSGRLPYDGESLGAIMNGHVNTPPPLDTLLDVAAPAQREAISRGMAKQASDRFASVTDLVRALERAAPVPVSAATTVATAAPVEVPTIEAIRRPAPAPLPVERDRTPTPAPQRAGTRRGISRVVAGTIAATLVVVAGALGLTKKKALPADAVAGVGRGYITASQLAGVVSQLPLTPTIETVREILDIWLEYRLVGQAAVDGLLDDSATLAASAGFALDNARQETLRRLMRPPVAVPAEFVDSVYRAGDWLYASHILSSNRRDADAALARLRRGADFATLARELSADSLSRAAGGDLGMFYHTVMVPEFSDGVRRTPPGNVSRIIRTAFGYHVAYRPALDAVRDTFTALARNLLESRADSILLDSLERGSRLEPEALSIARSVIGESLYEQAGSRKLSTFAGGYLDEAGLQRYLRAGAARWARSVVADGSDSALTAFLRALIRHEILMTEANRRDVRLTSEQWARLRASQAAAIDSVVRAAGLAVPPLATERDPSEAAARRVDAYVGALARRDTTRLDVRVPSLLAATLWSHYRPVIRPEQLVMVVSSLPPRDSTTR